MPANQLLSAQEGSGTAWHSSYDGNGSPVLNVLGEILTDGAKGYAFNSTGFLE